MTTTRQLLEDAPCDCRQCLRDRDEHRVIAGVKYPAEMMWMIVCEECGDKRCPHAADHRHPCTGVAAIGERMREGS